MVKTNRDERQNTDERIKKTVHHQAPTGKYIRDIDALLDISVEYIHSK